MVWFAAFAKANKLFLTARYLRGHPQV